MEAIISEDEISCCKSEGSPPKKVKKTKEKSKERRNKKTVSQNKDVSTSIVGAAQQRLRAITHSSKNAENGHNSSRQANSTSLIVNNAKKANLSVNVKTQVSS